MAHGIDTSDWTARWERRAGGSLSYGSLRGRFWITPEGALEIVWLVEPKPGPRYARMIQAAELAAAKAAGR